jgi:hypothetical protein
MHKQSARFSVVVGDGISAFARGEKSYACRLVLYCYPYKVHDGLIHSLELDVLSNATEVLMGDSLYSGIVVNYDWLLLIVPRPCGVARLLG